MKLDKDLNRLQISGKLAKMTYGKITTMVKGKEKTTDKAYYQFSINAQVDAETAAQIDTLYYDGVEDGYKPKWVKGEEKVDANGNCFYNFKSLFDIKIFDGDECFNYSDFLAHCGGTAPLGSQVTFSIICKEGALYLAAIRIDELKKASVDDFFS